MINLARFRPKIVDAAKGYSSKDFIKDLSSGITVGVIALPLAIAFAIASGLKPEAGLISAVIGGFLISLFGGSKVAAVDIAKHPFKQMPDVPKWDESRVEDADESVVISHNWDELRLLMWNYVGIVRTNRRLERALHRIELLRDEVQEYYANFRVTRDLLELRNLLSCAELIVRSALMRKESRGLHYSRDYPQSWTVSYPTILTPLNRY